MPPHVPCLFWAWFGIETEWIPDRIGGLIFLSKDLSVIVFGGWWLVSDTMARMAARGPHGTGRAYGLDGKRIRRNRERVSGTQLLHFPWSWTLLVVIMVIIITSAIFIPKRAGEQRQSAIIRGQIDALSCRPFFSSYTPHLSTPSP